MIGTDSPLEVDYDTAYLVRLRETVLDHIELDLGQDPVVVGLRTSGFLGPRELDRWLLGVRRGFEITSRPWLVDVGSGLGSFGCWLARHSGAKRLTGVEPSPLAVHAASRGNALACAEFVHGELRDAGLPGAVVGAAVALDVFHLLDDPGSVIAELGRVLAHGAILGLTTFGSSPPEHLVAQLSSAGFRDIRAEDVTEPWRAWMQRRHRERLVRADELRAELGAAAEGYIALSRSIVGQRTSHPQLHLQRRWWIEAERGGTIRAVVDQTQQYCCQHRS